MRLFLDSMGGGAWPFLVGGVICLVNSVNERDLNLLTSVRKPLSPFGGFAACVVPALGHGVCYGRWTLLRGTPGG